MRTFADTVLEHGRDVYGDEKTPLLVDGLHVETVEPTQWKKDGETWVLCNFASQQTLMRLLDGLTELTADGTYRKTAEDATRDALGRLQAPSRLLYWGGHLAWDLDRDKPVGQGTDAHKMKGHHPYYRLMYRVAPDRAVQLMQAVWAGHILDWSRLDYNRHASVRRTGKPPRVYSLGRDASTLARATTFRWRCYTLRPRCVGDATKFPPPSSIGVSSIASIMALSRNTKKRGRISGRTTITCSMGVPKARDKTELSLPKPLGLRDIRAVLLGALSPLPRPRPPMPAMCGLAA